MTNRQFNFSLTVGIALAVVGAFILSKAAVGLSLIALGLGIAALAMVTRFSSKDSAGERAAARVKSSRDNQAGYRSGALTE